MVDLLSTLIGLGIGVVVAVGVSYFVLYPRSKSEPVPMATRDASGMLSVSSVSTDELERSRRELRTMMLERDLLSSALMKVYEAETEGRITRDERESIAKKYSDQIKAIQAKLKDVELVVEVGELEKLRGELVALFEQKIQNIEARLDQAKQRLGVVAPEIAKEEPSGRIERGAELERVIEKRTRADMSDSERRVKEIRDAVMEELTKLEQIDIDKKSQDTS